MITKLDIDDIMEEVSEAKKSSRLWKNVIIDSFVTIGLAASLYITALLIGGLMVI